MVCGDWTRVCGGDWQDNLGVVGMFFDPPYGVTDRRKNIYHCDSTTVAGEVLEWCKNHGGIETYRIVLSGYEEYEELGNLDWTSKSWTAHGGYSNLGKGKNQNRKREKLWFSPHCLKMELFAESTIKNG